MTPEEENTWRSLKDEPLVRTSWLCFLKIHRWTKWSKPYKYGSDYYQGRCCVHCNSISTKEIAYSEAAYIREGT